MIEITGKDASDAASLIHGYIAQFGDKYMKVWNTDMTALADKLNAYAEQRSD